VRVLMTMLLGVALLAPAALAQTGPTIPASAGGGDIKPAAPKAKPAAKKPPAHKGSVSKNGAAHKTTVAHKTVHKGAGAKKTGHKTVAKTKAPAHKGPAKHVGLEEALVV
jgi:hypothetical protein